MSHVLNDRPIERPEADIFGRDTFAEAVANALVLSPQSSSIVIAIEGEWGTGKTSVLNMVSFYLEQHPEKPLIIHLDSWLLANSGSIVQRFLAQVAAALGRDTSSEKAAAAAEKLLKFSKVLAPARLIPPIEPVATAVQKALQSVGESAKAYAELSKLDIQKMKAEVAGALRETTRPIVVMLDDLDRLDPEETREVFRLIKAVADFERVSYLIAYDPLPVFQALSFGGVYNGTAYLEKIVQLSYPLPVPAYRHLKNYLEAKLGKLFENQSLRDFETRRLRELISQGGLAHAVRTPRDINRLINKLSISLPATRGEVNAADVVAFELLAVKYVNVAQIIRRRPFEFVGGWLSHDEPLLVDHIQMSKESKRPPDAEPAPWKKALWENLPPEESRPLVALLEFLFPGFTGAIYSFNISGNGPEIELRICRPVVLLKLLAVGNLAGAPSAREVNKFFSDSSGRGQALDEILGSESGPGWFIFAAKFLDNAQINDPASLVESLLAGAAKLGKSDRTAAGGLIGEMANFVIRLLKVLPSGEAEEIFLQIARSALSLSLSHDVVLYVAKTHDLWPRAERRLGLEMVISNRAVAEEGISLWLETVRRKSKKFYQLINEPGAIDILFRWGQFGSYEEVQGLVEQFTGSEEGIQAFHDAWLPHYRMSGFELFFEDWRVFKARCEQHPGRQSFRSDLWECFDVLEREERGEATGE